MEVTRSCLYCVIDCASPAKTTWDSLDAWARNCANVHWHFRRLLRHGNSLGKIRSVEMHIELLVLLKMFMKNLQMPVCYYCLNSIYISVGELGASGPLQHFLGASNLQCIQKNTKLKKITHCKVYVRNTFQFAVIKLSS